MKKENKVSRRSFAKTAAAGIVGLAVGAGIGYGASSMMKPPGAPGATTTVTSTKTVTAGAPGAPAPVISKPPGASPEERALLAAKKYAQDNNLTSGFKFPVLAPSGLAKALDASSKKFAEATGAEFEWIVVPHEEIFTKGMLEATQKAGTYACLAARPRMIGEFVGAGLVHDLTEYIWYYDPRMYGKPDGFPYPHCFSTVQNVGGGMYCLPIDADWGMHSFRKKYMVGGEATNFERQYGYAAKVPETYEEYYNYAEFCTRPPDLFGNGEARKIGNGYMQFFMYWAKMKEPTAYPFDDDMNPMINDAEGIEAIDEYIGLKPFQPEDLINWGYAEQVNNFVKNAYTCEGFWPPSINHFAWADPDSKIKGDAIASPAIGAKRPDGSIHRRGSIMGGWVIFVVTTFEHPELGYLYAQAASSPEGLVVGSTVPGSWMDAQRYNQMGDPDLLDPRFREYYGDPNYHSIDGVRHNLYMAQEQAAGLTPPNLSMNGENEYFLTLDKELNRAWLGEIDSAKCAENAEDLWNDVTDKIGRDRQISDWKWLKPLYMFAQ
jgi:multiple sugar transport system substrate-binding protein